VTQAFVGRAEELEALVDLAGTSGPGPAAVVVVGEPGSGKSRLLAEARGRSGLAHSFAVVGFESERHVPLAAASGLLRALGDVEEHGAQVEAVLFDAAGAAPLEPVRLFEAAHRAFRMFEPSLLVVDDLQWVDELSLALCHYLIRAADESNLNLRVFAASRPGGGRALADALPPERVSWIELGPLSREDGVELLRRLDPRLDRGHADELWERAQGSPFWLEALARAGGGVAGLGQVLTAQLRGAGADAGTLLGLLAVAGRPLPLPDAAVLSEWPPERLDAAIRELVDRGLVVESGGAVRLAHDLIRDAAIAELPEETRRRLHHRLAERLELDAGSDLRRLGRALEHRRAAGLPTFDLALRLARSPQRKLLGPEGLRLLAGLADDADPFAEEALELREEVASLATDLAEHEEALARWALVADRAEAPLQRASALLEASKAAYALARVDDARDLLARSRQIGAADEVLELEQRTHDGEIRLWLEQRALEGPALASEAVAAADRLAARAGGVSALDARARRAYLAALQLEYEVAVQEDDPETMLRSAEARAAAARGFDLDSYLAASVAACVPLRWTGQMAEAARRLRSIWAEAHRQILPALAVEAGFWLANTHRSVGELLEAEGIAREAHELAGRAGDVPRARHRIVKIGCDVALERGEPWSALERLERETAAEPNEHQRIAWHGDLARWTARLKGPGAAAAVREQLASGHACAERVGCARCRGDLLLQAAEALARIGDRAAGREMLAAWDLDVHTDELKALARSHAGALAEEDVTARAERLAEVLARGEDSAFRLDALWVRLDLGLALADAGDVRAVDELERAATVARDLGAGTVEELAEHALRSIGVRTWRRSAAGEPLTEREQAVARLVAEGATNREIARVLFLSPKTVERHVSNTFRKVGVRNRAELAARLRDFVAEGEGNAR
jgi:DNA-binding CsgD family transcriptional regulator